MAIPSFILIERNPLKSDPIQLSQNIQVLEAADTSPIFGYKNLKLACIKNQCKPLVLMHFMTPNAPILGRFVERRSRVAKLS